MTEAIEAVTTAALALALDAASLRQRAAAANIANAGTDRYVPVQVSFEAQLEDVRAALRAQGTTDLASLADVQPRLEPVPSTEVGVPARVQLDVEVARMSQNAAHYQALVKAVSNHLSILSLAVSDGKK